MNLRNKHRDEGEVHTGPLNDILFILLLFFLIVSTLANPNVIKLSQPKSKSDTRSKQTVVVSIDVNQAIFCGHYESQSCGSKIPASAISGKGNRPAIHCYQC